ncbi:MAG: DUF1800 domain-containing protein [Pseudomonadota bacterium]
MIPLCRDPGTSGPLTAALRACAVFLLCLTAACGGGGGGDDAVAEPVGQLPDAPPAPDPSPAPQPSPPPDPDPETDPEPDPGPGPAPPAPVTKAALEAASRFADQAAFGLPPEMLNTVAATGHAAWLEEQFELPATRHMTTVEELVARWESGELVDLLPEFEIYFALRRIAWWHHTVTAEDVVRQRVAFALSEIFVVSDSVTQLLGDPIALTSYYDMLLDNAFGNFRDLLRAVALHPAMGIYLSHANNRKANPAANTFPDENFAREVMQLFTIGLYELNLDGSQRLDGDGKPIATYNNGDIREFAKVFTGLSFGGTDAFFGNREGDFRLPMAMFDAFHEPGTKHLLNGAIIPDGQTGTQDIDAAIDNLFQHPNTAPFFARQLIQRLVTSNPSPSYVERVARVFNGEFGAPRGDLKAVIAAVLLDVEASAPAAASSSTGKVREPVARLAGLLRQFNASAADGFIAYTGIPLQELAAQHPLSSPSVFNFYLPDHSPAGAIADAGMVAPELQIVTSTTVVGMANLLDLAVTSGRITDLPEPFAPMTLDLSNYLALADDPAALIDELDVLLTHGQLSTASRDVILDAVTATPDLDLRLRTALYLLLISPDYTVRQ